MSESPRRRRGVGWALIFAVLFALSMDFWWWDRDPQSGPFQLPRWIYYFVLLQFALAATVHVFGRRYWRDVDLPDGAKRDGG